MYLSTENHVSPQQNISEIIAQNLRFDHSAKLRTSALNDADIVDCKYFSTTNKSQAKRLIGYSFEGLIIPYLDPTGEPYKCSNGKPFYRIRPDWGDAPDADEKPKYLSPKGQGNRPYFAPTYKDWAKALRFKQIPIHITESEFKAASLGAAGYAAIGLCGVHGFVDKTTRVDDSESIPAQLLEDGEYEFSQPEKLEVSQILPELQFINNINIWAGRKVYISFDSDIVHKWQVKNALFKLAEWLESKGAEPLIVLLPTELNGDKNGVDDLIYRHGKEAYETLLYWGEPAIIHQKKRKVVNIQTDPKLVIKADLLRSVLKERWRNRYGVGWHYWTGTHWQLQDKGSGYDIGADIHEFMRQNGWTLQGQNDKGNLLDHMYHKLASRDWNPIDKIAFANGTLNVETGEFTTQHRREDCITYCLPYRYDPIARCIEWERFIKEALNGDDSAVQLVQAFFRWALAPKPKEKYDLEVCWDLYGVPGTGKGTVIDILKQVVGEENTGWFSTKTFNNDNALSALMDKPVSICPDDSGHLDDPGKFNRIISNEPVQVKRLYKDSFSTTLNTFLVRAYNKFITTTSGAQGLDRRIVAMAFSNIPKAVDPDLGKKLSAELPGIFNWAMSISLTEAKRRIRWSGNVEAVRQASTERFLFNNPAYEFLLEFFPNGGEGKIRDLHRSYAEWSKDKGEQPLSEKVFKTQVLNFGVVKLPKINGIELYSIPALKRDNVVSHLRIAANAPDQKVVGEKEIGDRISPIPPYSTHISPVHPPYFPQTPQDTARVSSGSGEIGEIGETFFQTSPGDAKNSKTSTGYKKPQIAKSSTSTKSNSTPQPPESKVLPNPEGTITYQKLLKGEIGTTVIRFESENIAREWQKFIYQVFGYDGSLELMAETQDGFNWKLIFDEFDKKAIERLEQKDLSKPVPKRS